MRRFLIAVVVLMCSISADHWADAKTIKCRVPELFGQEPYDDLVCSGIAMMAQHNYKQAIATFEKAMSIPLLDAPNFTLFPRLALAYYHEGDKGKAAELLKKGELSLMVLTRILSCDENSPDAKIVENVWGKSYKVDSLYQSDIASLMCGAAYDGFYHRESLAELVGESSLVRNYLDIKKKIDGGK